MTVLEAAPAGSRRALKAVDHPGERPQGRGHRQGPRRRRVADAALAAVGLGLGASVALPLSQVSAKSLSTPGGFATLAGNLTAMAGTYLLLIMVLLTARIPAVERAIGQDRLIRLHRRMSSAPLLLLTAHGVLSTLGYAQSGHTGFLAAGGSLITTMAWILAAVVSYVMIVGIAAVSIRAVRRRFSYDTWWVIHLYTYLALAFSIPHQIIDGTSFVGHPLAQGLWTLLWLSTAGAVVLYRLGLPIARSLYHRLEVAQVNPEAPGVYSLVVKGRHLDQLAVAGGQYFGWRFLKRGLWWHAHPFSLSAMPHPPYMRVTVKAAGDTTEALSRLRPGTRIAVEGPYGTFTDSARTKRKVALIGAGVGITPLRALLEDFPGSLDVVVVQRASTPDQLVHNGELASMVAARHGRMVELVGSRRRHRLDEAAYLHDLVPDITSRDVYVCGPDGFAAGVASAARALGVPAESIHLESFQL